MIKKILKKLLSKPIISSLKNIRRFFNRVKIKSKTCISKYLLNKKPIGAILMLHRIDEINPNKLWYNEHLKLSPSFLDNFIVTAKQKGYTFVSLNEMKKAIQEKKGKKLLCITIDDGYKDNYTKGLDVFKKHNVPFLIYVTPGMIEKDFIYWWYILEDIINSNEKVTLSTGETFDCSTTEEKGKSFLAIRQVILTLDQKKLLEELPKLLHNYKIDIHAYNDTLPLSWQEIKNLTKEPLATIAHHTYSHFSFKASTYAEIEADMNKADNLFEKHIGKVPEHFAFPFGCEAINDGHIEYIEKRGFSTSATTEEKPIFNNTNIFALPRFFISERNTKDFFCKL